VLPRTLRFIESRFAELSVPVLQEAFRAIFSYGGTVAGLSDLSGFAPAVPKPKIEPAALRQVSEGLTRGEPPPGPPPHPPHKPNVSRRGITEL
jgi:hypothetical protein